MFQETNIAMLTEDQTNQLLSSFWIQANQTDNTPFNYEAIGHSYSLTVLSSRLKVWICLEEKYPFDVLLMRQQQISQKHKVVSLLSTFLGNNFIL
jgi:hypothetical protein